MCILRSKRGDSFIGRGVRSRLGLPAFNYNNDFPFRLVHCEILGQFAQRAAMHRFVNLAYLAADGGVAVGTEGLAQLLQRARKAVRTLIHSYGSRFLRQLVKARGKALFHRQKALENEPVGGQPGAY